MKKTRILSVLSLFSAIVLLFVFMFPAVGTSAADSENSITAPIAADKAEADTDIEDQTKQSEAKELTNGELEQLFVSMLDVNHCYNSALGNEESLTKGAAAALCGYATDFAGYGYCVSYAFASNFVKSMYGVDLPEETVYDDAPEGYIAVPAEGIGTTVHAPVSFAETGEGIYETVTCMTVYYGGDDEETCLVKSVFKADTSSAFGFILVKSETL